MHTRTVLQGMTMATRVNRADSASVQFSYLSESQAVAIFNEMVETLQHTGVNLHHEGARYLLSKQGCNVRGNRVCIPARLVRTALSTVPQITVIYGWDGVRKLRIEQNRTYFGPGLTCPHFIDPRTGERRKYLKEDSGVVARICDALPNIGFVQALGSVSDGNKGLAEVYEFAEMIQNTTKPLLAWGFTRETCRDIHKIAVAMAGGRENFRRHPNFIFYSEPISPLVSDFNAMDKLIYCAENRIPQVYAPTGIGGGTHPATHAGHLVCALAEAMLGVVVSQLVNPGTCIIIGGPQTILDMRRSTVSYGAPELSVLSAGLTEMALYCGLPMFSTAGCTDANTMDLQAAIEAGLSIHSAMMSSANLVHDVGFMESAMTGSLFQLVMADEIIGMSRRIAEGIVVNEETLALEEIHNVGPGGHYLYEDHTLNWFRAHWQPGLMDRNNYEEWSAKGEKTTKDRIREKTLDLLENYEGPYSKVPEKSRQKIGWILQDAEERVARGEDDYIQIMDQRYEGTGV